MMRTTALSPVASAVPGILQVTADLCPCATPRVRVLQCQCYFPVSAFVRRRVHGFLNPYREALFILLCVMPALLSVAAA